MQAAIRFCCLAGLITLLAGCSKDNSSDPVLTLSTQNISLTGTILREQMEITTDAAWSISHDDAPWITVAPAEGPAGLSVVEITATAPEDYLPRTGSLSVRSANGLFRKVSITQTGAEAPAGSEQAALIALYNSLGGPKWREQTNWLSNKPVGEWKGVRTDADEHVVSLYFYANNLIGWLPEQIGDFPYLEQLTFSHDQISGSIPASIGKLTRLQTLDFTVNKLSGAIPNDITRLTELRTLALNDNKLGGTLPAELGKLTRLESLTLHNNSIRGEIPESITQLEKDAQPQPQRFPERQSAGRFRTIDPIDLAVAAAQSAFRGTAGRFRPVDTANRSRRDVQPFQRYRSGSRDATAQL